MNTSLKVGIVATGVGILSSVGALTLIVLNPLFETYIPTLGLVSGICAMTILGSMGGW